MNNIGFFPPELSRSILERVDYPTLLTAKYVAKGWNEEINSFLKESIFSHYFPGVQMTDTFFEQHVVTSIDHVLVKMRAFLKQLKAKNQTGEFSVFFPFNSSKTVFEIKIKKEDQEDKEFDRKEILIFMKRIEGCNSLEGANWYQNGKSYRCEKLFPSFEKYSMIFMQIKILLQTFSLGK